MCKTSGSQINLACQANVCALYVYFLCRQEKKNRESNTTFTGIAQGLYSYESNSSARFSEHIASRVKLVFSCTNVDVLWSLDKCSPIVIRVSEERMHNAKMYEAGPCLVKTFTLRQLLPSDLPHCSWT